MDFSDVTEQFKQDLARVEKAIKKNYESDVPLIPGISNYLMNGGGKRMRPLLVLIFSKLGGVDIDDKAIHHACVVEYIHAATLLHDDVVDETTVRRGHETVNSKWGSDASILVGDFLISRAILLLAHDNNIRITRAIAEAARILVEGGILEFTHARRLDVTEQHCLDVVYRKTASIISASCQMGMLLANASPEQENAAIAFGNFFGIAFQLMDDALDYEGDEELLGKPPGTDFKEGHVTLPLLHLYSKSNEASRKKIERFVRNGNTTQQDFEWVLSRMRENRSPEYTQNLARSYMVKAKEALQSVAFPNPEYLDHAFITADYVIERYSPAPPVN
ncbi:MAG: polyprenyl-diphosphate synthase [Nitrospinae bacterium CG11_big_fil_rev_8_21_14_0_20_56_8]|nr:MAG: polyprenyl-diphosphate synthase [Nitrospinae bacterium CG11_big_fil_rev_8_21_14_0_20_56_8]